MKNKKNISKINHKKNRNPKYYKSKNKRKRNKF